MFNFIKKEKKINPKKNILSYTEAIQKKILEEPDAKKKPLVDEVSVLEAAQMYRKGVTSVLDLISPSAMAVESRYVDLGGKLVSTMFVVTYPRYIAVGWFAPIILSNFALDIGMFFYPIRSDIILKQLKNKVGTLEAQISTDREKGAPRDPIRETALRDIEQLRDDLTQGVEKFFQYALYVSVYADSEK
ncbi:MAG TPA: conjugal transfer protein TraC, partial [Patescibacteria group bacterium]|nr:conjugal transfer protein TraC [Patescibacteria group bacterium]